MATGSRYKQILDLLQKLPKSAVEKSILQDSAESSADLTFTAKVKKDFLKIYEHGESTVITDPKRLEQLYGSLHDLVKNKHKLDYPYKHNSATFKSTLEELREVLEKQENGQISTESANPSASHISVHKTKTD